MCRKFREIIEIHLTTSFKDEILTGENVSPYLQISKMQSGIGC